ncbi:MAG TPA: SusC/RagA family TonB-linked outer membrane protein [Bacteroidales bacterium]
MKLTILTLGLCIMQVSASTTNGQNFDLQVKNQTLKEILKEIENKTTYRFFYNDFVMDLNKTVTLTLNDKNIQQVMDELLNGSEVSYRVLNNNLVVIAPALELQQIKVSGTVVSSKDGQPLPGVSVMEKGTANGAISDEKGRYSLTVQSSNATLIFSFIGYQIEEKAVGGQSTIDVSLTEDIRQLDEIVVVGYGTAKKSDISGSIVSVSSEDMLKKAPTNIIQGLQGVAAGVMVTSQDGAPDANAAIRIRGVATINGSANPLYVVDGVQVGTNANFLNPSDIQNVEILKDASATAIYGSAGANGVIMITTKHGKAGATHFTFTADYGIQTLSNTLDVCGVDQYASNIRTARANDGAQLQNQVFAAQYDGKRKYIDWQKQMTRVGIKQQYTLSASGGTEKSQTAVSLGFLNNDGIIVNTNFKRLTARLTSSSKVASFIELGGEVNFSHDESHGSNQSFGNNGNLSSLRDIAFTCPTMDYVDPTTGQYVSPNVVNSNGTYGIGIQTGVGQYDGGIGNAGNIYAEQMENNGLNKNNRMLAIASANIKVFKGLDFRSVSSFNYSTWSWNRFWGNKKRYENDGLTQVDLTGYDTRYEFNLQQNQNYSLAIENYLTYNWKNDIHNLTLMAGNSVSRSFGMQLSADAKDFSADNVRKIALTADQSSRTGDGWYNDEVHTISYFGRATYSLKDRYNLTATLRRDGSSNFGSGNRWGVFPSAAASWRISEEDFLKNNTVISNLKLRLGWGLTGNSGDQGSLAVSGLSSSSVMYNYYTEDGIAGIGTTATTENGTVALLVDTKLKWETNEQSNAGIDLGLLNNTLNITADYFIRTSKDLLLYKTIRPSAGYTQVYTNYGEIRNNGLELSINYNKRLNQDWTIGATLNGSTLKNKVIKMGSPLYKSNTSSTNDGSNVGGVGSDSGVRWTGHSVSQEGYAVGSFYGYVVEGVFQTQAEVDAANAAAHAADASVTKYQEDKTGPGDFKYKDLNGDGKITDADRTVLGNGFPKLNYGLNLTASYKNWDISVYAYGVYGQKINSYSAMTLSNMVQTDNGTTPNILKEAVNEAWTPTNHSNTLSKLSILDNNFNMRASNVWIKNGDFLKISNVQIGYNINNKFLKPLRLQSVRIYASVQNLVCISSYNKYGDPEAGQGSVLFTGVDTGRYPMPRTYSFGVNLQF